MHPERQYEVAIIGGGPAGLSAAIWLARYRHRVVLIDSGDPRNWETRGIHGYLGLPDVRPMELRARGREEARRYGATLLDAHVERVCQAGEERFVLDAYPLSVERASPRELAMKPDAGLLRIEASRVLLAIGIRDVWPDVPGLDRCYGETVHHCPDCDGYEARDQQIAVIAKGRSAAGMALALTTWSDRITICTNGETADIAPEHASKLDALGIDVHEERIVRLHERNGEVRHLELAGGRRVPCERIFFSIGHGPADDLGVQLGCARDDLGMLEVDHAYHTSVRNVWAAGDIVPGPHLGIVAAAHGAVAASAIHKSLLPEGRRL